MYLDEYQDLINKFADNPIETWRKLAEENIFWHKSFNQVLDDSEKPFYKWFPDGKTNISYNCLDLNLKARANKKALIFEDEAGLEKSLTYSELHYEVVKFAAYLKSLGIKKGDRVCIYMSLSPEAIIAMQACTRIGAIHSVVFAGFAATALKDRIEELEAKLLITQNGFYRRAKIVELINTVNEAINENSPIKDIVLFQRINENNILGDKAQSLEFLNKAAEFLGNIKNLYGINIHYPEKDLVAFNENKTLSQLSSETLEWLNSTDSSFILYTSGSTGRPKGIEHSTAGYLLWAKLTTKWVFDIKDDDIYWCTADIGWITGHSYLAYGPLVNGMTIFIYEGAPNYPDESRFWKMIEKHRINIFYTAPTAIRSFQAWGLEHIEKHDLSSLRLLGSVGEPIGAETWKWFHNHIGKSKCPIVDTWWQTETGGIMISTLANIHKPLAGVAGPSLPGISAEVNEEGLLHISQAWPGMLKGVYKNPERFIKAYWSKIPNSYLPGDLAEIVKIEANSELMNHPRNAAYIKIGGRNDDVINVSGHRLGTAEIETALAKHPVVTEAAVISIPHDIKGEGIIAFIVSNQEKDLETILKDHVAHEIGTHARPERIIRTKSLPKTRSGKVMRRILKEIAQGKIPEGDLSTLEDKSVIEQLLKAALIEK